MLALTSFEITIPVQRMSYIMKAQFKGRCAVRLVILFNMFNYDSCDRTSIFDLLYRRHHAPPAQSTCLMYPQGEASFS